MGEEDASFSGASECLAGEPLCSSEDESLTDTADAASNDAGSEAGSSGLVLGAGASETAASEGAACTTHCKR